MITYIKIDGFKSFRNFEMTFTPFTVIAGANASGKSNLFDALKLLSDLSHSDLKNAFTNQRGEAIELFTQYGNNNYVSEMSFIVELLVDKNIKDSWGGKTKLKYTRLRYRLKIARKINTEGIDELFIQEEHLEPIRHQKDTWVYENISKQNLEFWRPKVKTGKRGKPYIYTELRNNIPTIKLPQDGRPGGKETPANAVIRTVLSGIDDINFPHAFAAREEMKNWKFLQLNPDDLREPTKKQIGMSDIITQTGENLAAALFRIQSKDRFQLKEISRKLNNLLPNLIEVNVYDDKANNQYIIKLTSEDGKEFSSRVLSEGTLRLLTLCIFLFDDMHKSLLCYEEPENGIHPFRINFLTKLLYDLSVNFNDTSMPLRQILVNTHSPVLVGEIINWSKDKRVSIWYSQLNSLVTDIEEKRTKMNITKILPVVKKTKDQLEMSFPKLNLNESEIKLTLSQVKRYLETTDIEQSINVL
ncbi:MAG: AAA family ATPase [Bacteroidota bacterium]